MLALFLRKTLFLTHEPELEPNPAKEQVDDHSGNREAHPGSKIQGRIRTSEIGHDALYVESVTFSSQAQTNHTFKTRFGPVPVRVAVPPVLAAYATER